MQKRLKTKCDRKFDLVVYVAQNQNRMRSFDQPSLGLIDDNSNVINVVCPEENIPCIHYEAINCFFFVTFGSTAGGEEVAGAC